MSNSSGSVMEWHSIEMHSFLRSFEWSTQTVDDCVHIKTSLSSDHRKSLSFFLWGTCLSRSITLVDELTSVLETSQISSEDLMGSFVSYWLHTRTPATPSMLLHSYRILRFLCSLISNYRPLELFSLSLCDNSLMLTFVP